MPFTIDRVVGPLRHSHQAADLTLSLDDLADVFVSSPTDTYVVAWVAANSRFELVAPAAGGGGAPTDAQYVTLATNGTLSDERVLTGTANQIVITDNGAGSTAVLSTPQNIHTAATVQFSSVTAPLIVGGSGTTQTLTYKTTTGVGATGGRHIFQVGNNGATEAMTILNNGRVGIGTPTPLSIFHMTGGSATFGAYPLSVDTARDIANFFISNSSNAGIVRFYNGGTGQGMQARFIAGLNGTSQTMFTDALWWIASLAITGVGGTPDSNLMEFRVRGPGEANSEVGLAASTRMAILGSGNVGIGTTTPTNLLSLGGDAARTIWMERHTASNTQGNNLTVQAGGATVSATDKNGGILSLEGGLSTGTGISGVRIRISPAAGSGTGDNAVATMFEASGNGLAFYAGTPTAKQTVTGSRLANPALASLLTALATIGLITDSSS